MGETPGKRRAVLSECESKLNCSPRTRILRDYKQSERRSPRKHDNIVDTEMSSPRDVPRHKLSFGTPPILPATPTGIVPNPTASPTTATTPSPVTDPLASPNSPSRALQSCRSPPPCLPSPAPLPSLCWSQPPTLRCPA